MRLRQEAAWARQTRAADATVAVGIRHGERDSRVIERTALGVLRQWNEAARKRACRHRARGAWERGAWQSRRSRVCLPRFPALPDGARHRDHRRGGAGGGGGMAGLPDHASRHRPWLYRAGAVSSGADFHFAGWPCRRPLRSACGDPGLLLAAGGLYARRFFSLRCTAYTAFVPIYAVLFFIGTGRAFSGPASSALVPHLVPQEHFVNAVTWGATIFQIAEYRRAGGGRHAVHAAAGAGAAAYCGARWSFCSPCSRWSAFSR